MSNALEALKEGNFDAALSAAKVAVRDDPGDPDARAQLFQIFCLNGEWERADAQLEALLTSNQVQAPIWKQFQILTKLEGQRQVAHASAKAPAIVGEPEDWMAGFAKSFELHMSGDVAGGSALREESLETASVASGSVDDVAFEWLMDGDSRYGPMLEAYLPTEGDYCWVPFTALTSLRIEKPTQLNHFIWVPAHFTWKDGRVLHGYVPSRYVGSETSTDRNHTMARGTDWNEVGSDVFIGSGQRVLLSSENDFPILDLREARFQI